MDRIQDYKILTCESAIELTAIVRRYLELGWEPVSCAQTAYSLSGEWHQTMVKLKAGVGHDNES